jgi:hypothetical protein
MPFPPNERFWLFHLSKSPSCASSQSHPSPTLTPGNHWTGVCCDSVEFWECHSNGIIQHIILWDWPFSLSVTLLRYKQVSLVHSFLLSEQHSMIRKYQNAFIHSPTTRHSSGFSLLKINVRQVQWLTPITLITRRLTLGGLQFKASPVKKSSQDSISTEKAGCDGIHLSSQLQHEA